MKDHHVKHLEVKEVTNNEAIEKSEKNEKREKEFHKYVKILRHIPVRFHLKFFKSSASKSKGILIEMFNLSEVVFF